MKTIFQSALPVRDKVQSLIRIMLVKAMAYLAEEEVMDQAS
jgi:hypothetical protein